MIAGSNHKSTLKRKRQTLLDSGSGKHIFHRVDKPIFKRTKLTGIAAEAISNVVGEVGTLKNVIQLDNAPANLISVGKLFEDKKWRKFIITKNQDNAQENTGGAF